MPQPTRRDVHVDAALSTISVAYKNTDYIAEMVFPQVPVNHISDKYYVFPPSSWFRDEAKVRAPTAEPALVDYIVNTGSYQCIEYAVSHLLADQVRNNADDPLRPEIEATELVTDKLMLAQEIRVANLVTGSGNWTNAGSASSGTKWSSDTSDPFNDIMTAVRAVSQQIGRPANTIAMSGSSWYALTNHPDMLDRFKHTVTGGTFSPEQFASLFGGLGIQRALVGHAIKDTAVEGASRTVSYVWGDNTWVGYVPPSAGLFMPASGYLFEFGARRVDRFRKDSRYSDLIVATHTVDEVVTGSEAGYVIISTV